MLAFAFATLVAASSSPGSQVLVLDVAATDLEKDEAKRIQKAVAASAQSHGAALDQGATTCDVDAPACLKQIAAGGHAYVLSTRAGKISGNYTVAASLVDTKTAAPIAQAAAEGWSVDELLAKLTPALDDVWSKLPAATPTADTATTTSTAAATTPKPAAQPFDVRLGLEIGGGVAAGVGVLLVVVGAIPAFQYAGAKDELRTETESFDGSANALQGAAKTRQQALDDKALYNNVGHWAVDGGLLLVVAGAGALGYALFAPVPE